MFRYGVGCCFRFCWELLLLLLLMTPEGNNGPVSLVGSASRLPSPSFPRHFHDCNILFVNIILSLKFTTLLTPPPLLPSCVVYFHSHPGFRTPKYFCILAIILPIDFYCYCITNHYILTFHNTHPSLLLPPFVISHSLSSSITKNNTYTNRPYTILMPVFLHLHIYHFRGREGGRVKEKVQ